MKKLRIGLIGAGWIMPWHIRGWKALSEKAEVIAIADPNTERCHRLADDFNIPKQFRDYRDLLEQVDIEAVDVAVPTALHCEITVAACNAGKNVLCEKPMAINTKECQKMIEAAKRNDVLLMPLHNRIFFPPIKKAKELLKEGSIGQPQIYRGSFLSEFYPWPLADGKPSNWRGERSLSGGGVVIEAGVHQIYTAEYFMGKVNSVRGCVKKLVQDGSEIEDTGIVALEFESGAAGVLALQWNAGYPDDGCQIIGSEGAIIINGVELQVLRQPPLQVYRRNDKSWQFPSVEWNWDKSFEGTIEHFVDCLLEGCEPIVTAESGKSAIAVVEAIYHGTVEKR